MYQTIRVYKPDNFMNKQINKVYFLVDVGVSCNYKSGKYTVTSETIRLPIGNRKDLEFYDSLQYQ